MVMNFTRDGTGPYTYTMEGGEVKRLDHVASLDFKTSYDQGTVFVFTPVLGKEVEAMQEICTLREDLGLFSEALSVSVELDLQWRRG